jgi:hypothetical protein
MTFKLFVVPVGAGGQAEAELNAFLRGRKVLAVDPRWVEQGAASFWCFCLDLPRRSAGSAAATPDGAEPPGSAATPRGGGSATRAARCW